MAFFLGHELTAAAAVHGFNALALFGVAIYAGHRFRAAAPAAVEQKETPAAAPV
jgi:hypothetical protein